MFVSVSGEGSGVARTSYSLTCTVILPPGVAQFSPNIQWKRPNMPYTPASDISLTTRDILTTLWLPSLQSSDAGEYLCQASYSLGGYTSPLANGSFILNVICKLIFFLIRLQSYLADSHRPNNHSNNRRTSHSPNRASGVRGGSVSDE